MIALRALASVLGRQYLARRLEEEGPAMMPAMNMPSMPMQMPQTAMMMPGMGSMMPAMMGMPMMGMMPSMGMPMMGMPMMPGMMPMMCRMTMEMGKDGMTCKIMPMEGANMDMLRERCESMMKMMMMGVPTMMTCGASMMICTPSK